jgi:hypothetical protein
MLADADLHDVGAVGLSLPRRWRISSGVPRSLTRRIEEDARAGEVPPGVASRSLASLAWPGALDGGAPAISVT